MRKILLHTCCGPCFLGVWEDLRLSKMEVTNYFYNPNIWPEEEHRKRKENLIKVLENTGTKLIEEKYTPDDHKRKVSEFREDLPKRCLRCYENRLRKTAEYAKENNYDLFSTTLLVSPYQNHEALIKIGSRIGVKVGVKFYYKDYRTNYRIGQERAKKLDIYRQKYCGCQPSSEYR